MTQELAISLLRQGETGAQILQILDTIATPDAQDAEPTDQEVQF